MIRRRQRWQQLAAVGSSWQTYSNLEELLQNPDYLICRAIATAISTRCNESEPSQACPSSRIAVHNNDPYFLRTHLGDTPRKFQHRIDMIELDVVTVRFLISLNIEILPEGQESSRSSRGLEGSHSPALHHNSFFDILGDMLLQF